MILHQNPIVYKSDGAVLGHLTTIIKPGSHINDVIRLPFSWFFSCVYQGDSLFVYRSGLAIYIGSIGIIIQDLDLILGLEVDPAVATILAFAPWWVGGPPFYMQLTITKRTFGLNGTR